MFDAFDASDVKDDDCFKDSDDITYTAKVGGVKLGLDIANDIFDGGLKASVLGAGGMATPVATAATEMADVKVAPTIYSQK
jgi:hypothetical protein